ncbi:serine/threonine-protein kinase [Micromonospora rifamycinica]|uniref:non-specific serine/threonine protein kinase n=1 Tax=Micromonospora rifamycinica TaxID=291594 RepID=A0A109IJ43_9ACTN|nr:serine/threonine-protein kinase [Micromonospora rifamycinica]KWV31448.1 serine/threonine protein kinase [Micromonospora rifamycinica]SCG43174.1 serine/threonine protein kinase [Micromonospora rifamycinica]
MGVLSSELVLSGRYRLDERVATGGMGDVWRATDLVLGRQVAVKVLLPALVSDPDFIARFRSEARIMAALRNPGIVQVFDCGEDRLADGTRADYLVMEFVEGEPLSRRIESAGHLDVAETMSIVAQVAQALHAAHAGGIVHRDVKPSNLLVQEDGTVVLVDFGVARSTNVTSITSTNAVPGTALYMAPEQASGRPVSAATDIYALGAVTHCCLTGQPPFTGDNPLQVAVRHLDDEPPELPADIPGPVRALVARALAKDPADRFATGAEMAAAARAATGDGTAALTALVTPSLRDPSGANGPRVDPSRAPRTVVGPESRRNRRGSLVGALAAVLVALTALGAALGATKSLDSGTPNIRNTGPAVAPTDQSAVPTVVEETGSEEPDRTNRPDYQNTKPSPSVSVSPTPLPGGSSLPAPTKSAPTTPVGTPPTTTPAPVDPPPTTTPAPVDPPPTTADSGGGGGNNPPPAGT